LVLPDLLPPDLLAIGVLAASLAPAVFLGAADFEDEVLLAEVEEPFEAVELFDPDPLELFAEPDFDDLPVLFADEPEDFDADEPEDFDELPVLFEAELDDFEAEPELFDEPADDLAVEPLPEPEEPLEEPDELPVLFAPDDFVFPAAILAGDDVDRELAEPEAGPPTTDSITDAAAPVTAPAAAPTSASLTASFVLSYIAVKAFLFACFVLAMGSPLFRQPMFNY